MTTATELLRLIDGVSTAMLARPGASDVGERAGSLPAVIDHPTPEEQDSREMLMAQARSLNAVFAGLARRATAAQHVEQTESYMRVALKAQAQCARTLQILETLGRPSSLALVQVNHGTSPKAANELSGERGRG